MTCRSDSQKVLRACNQGSEDSEQITVVDWCHIMRVPVVHIPNEGKRSAAYGQRMKRMGVASGFPDLFIPLAHGGYHGLFIELKVGRNKPTQNQLDWLDRLAKAGYDTHVCYGSDAAIEEIKKYIRRGKENGQQKHD